MKRICAVLLAALLTLAACGGVRGGGETAGGEAALALTVRLPEGQDTLDPAGNTARGGETVLYHLFENLLRWEDGGCGQAALAPGQAERWEADTDYAGNTTYTFTLREGLLWSDGKTVTAQDFVDAWRRLADPSNGLPHRQLLSGVSGYDQVQETRDPSLLAVSAPDRRTFVVTLAGSDSAFLARVCAGAYTMPVRADLAARRGWGVKIRGIVTNGAYTATDLRDGQVTLERSETYYDRAAVGPERLVFVPGEGAEADCAAFASGEADLVVDLTTEALAALAETPGWTPEPVTEVFGVLVNTRRAPFDDPNVRLAFRLAVDTQRAAKELGDPSLQGATGLVPYGVADGCRPPAAPEAEEPTLPDPNASPMPEQEPEYWWDFRTHSLERVTVPAWGDYAADCLRARELLAQAGYEGGEGFPEVSYIYVAGPRSEAAARSLQAMWREQLGVTVALRALSQEEYDAMLAPGEGTEEESVPAYTLAGRTFPAGRWDAAGLLGLWHSGENLSGYGSPAFDILLDSAGAAVSAQAWDAYLHDAEAILLEDAPVIPVWYEGGGYLLREGLTGLFRAPDGVFFLAGVTRAETE